MAKRDLRVIVYPENNVYPAVTRDQVLRVINGSVNMYNPEILIELGKITKKRFIPQITDHIKCGNCVDIMFWNKPPEEEARKLDNYSVRNLRNVRLMSVVNN